jgi:hypothetical protein
MILDDANNTTYSSGLHFSTRNDKKNSIGKGWNKYVKRNDLNESDTQMLR